MYWVSFHRGLPQCILRIRDVNMCVHQSQVFLRWLALGAVFISSTSPAVCVCETVVFDNHIKTQTVPPEPKNLQQCFQIRYHCCHEKQNPDRLFMTYLPSWLHVCQEIIKKKKKPTRTMRTGFLLWLFTSVSVFLTCYECNRLIQVKITSNVCQQHCLTHTEAAGRRCSLLVHPCCLLTSSSLVRNKRVTRCFPSPFSGPWTTPTHTRLCVCLCESMDKTACTTGCAIIGQFVFSNWDASVRLLFYSCLR